LKILFVNPGQELLVHGGNPAAILIGKERGRNPPLGILYVASFVQKGGKHCVRVLDLSLGEMDPQMFQSYLRDNRFDVLGVTITTFTLLDALDVVRAFKEANPAGKVVAGGPHVAIYPAETVGLGCIDVAVKREGEPVINEILDRLEEPERLRDVKGICFRLGEEIIDTGEGPSVENLDALPFPDRTLLPYEKYYSLLGKDTYSTTLITSRGCPFKCAFCDRPALDNRFRSHSSDYVIEEIAACMKLGIREFLFYDDTFTVNRKRVMKLCEQISKRRLDIRYDIRTRVDRIDKEMLLALKSTGCYGVHYGIESGTERILKRLNKGVEIEQIREVFRLTKEIGMKTLAYIILGNPGETKAEIDETLQLIREVDPDYLHLGVLMPLPATAIYQQAMDEGFIKEDIWRQFAAEPTCDFIPPVWTENFSCVFL